MIFKTGSKLDAGNFVSYAIEPEVLNNVSFEVPFGWKKYDDIITRSNIANNGGYCFYGNNCPSKNRTSEISDFVIRSLSGECLGSDVFAVFNIYDMQLESTKFDCIALTNSYNNLFLKASDVEIKKCLIENAENCFVIEDASSFTFTVELTVACNTFINADFEGSFTFAEGVLLDITAGQTGFDMRINERVYLANQEFALTSNKKKTGAPLIAYNAGDALFNQDEPEEIEGE